MRKGLTAKQVEVLRIKILEEKKNLIFGGVYCSDEFNLKKEEMADDVDHAVAAQTSAHMLRFRNRENFYSRKLDQALDRINGGDYGFCEECMQPIGFTRLLARPTADLCISCKEEAEKDELMNISGITAKSVGKGLEETLRDGSRA